MFLLDKWLCNVKKQCPWSTFQRYEHLLAVKLQQTLCGLRWFKYGVMWPLDRDRCVISLWYHCLLQPILKANPQFFSLKTFPPLWEIGEINGTFWIEPGFFSVINNGGSRREKKRESCFALRCIPRHNNNEVERTRERERDERLWPRYFFKRTARWRFRNRNQMVVDLSSAS